MLSSRTMSETGTHWTTHTTIELHGDTVIKRFRSYSQGEPEREWRALTLLAEYAPGLAPTPIEADLAAGIPAVVMSRLDGVPLGEEPIGPAQLRALAEAISLMHHAIPTLVVSEVPLRPFHEVATIDQIQELHQRHERRHRRPVVARAVKEGMAWLAHSDRGGDWRNLPAVFGSGDGNLANYIWNGSGVQVVDFEHSGRSDRAFELAEIAENESVRAAEFDVPFFLQQFDLAADEIDRLRQCHRLLALANLLLLENSANPASSPDTIERQANRLLDVLA